MSSSASPPPTQKAPPVLEVEELVVRLDVPGEAPRTVLDGVNFSVPRGGLLGLIGESGSGKTVLANALLGYAREPGRIVGGKVLLDGLNVLKADERTLQRAIRGKRIGLIAANARANLNPMRRVGDLIADACQAHQTLRRKDAWERATSVLRAVGINDPEQRATAYLHEMSGGMAQRIMIALVLVNEPELIVADDCTNGLDVTVAAQVMELFGELLRTRNSSGIIITHDLGLVAQYCSTIAILHGGRIVEAGTVERFFDGPEHPYSKRLLASLPENKTIERSVPV